MSTTTDRTVTQSRRPAKYRIALPEPSQAYEQDEEWFLVNIGGTWEEIRFHDYGKLYDVEGLYEKIFYDILECDSPRTVRELLGREMDRAGVAAGELRALDLGAGNGIMGEELHKLGIESAVGVDILSEAADAARRDRPEVYAEYRVADFTRLDPALHAHLKGLGLNVLTCVAALGFGDIPPEAFRTAFNLVADGGWVAFNLRDRFNTAQDISGYHRMLRAATERGILELTAEERYTHRRATTGAPLYYNALVGRKHADIPAQMIG
jgi:SAM-dependent methyltransferase